MSELDLSQLSRLGPHGVRVQFPVTLRSDSAVDIAWSSELTTEHMRISTSEPYYPGQEIEIEFVDDHDETWTLKGRVAPIAERATVRVLFHDLGRPLRLALLGLISRLSAVADAEHAAPAAMALAQV